MAQSLLIDTKIAVDVMRPTQKGDIEIVFKEYEPCTIPGETHDTGRAWSGMITDQVLFDCLTSAGLIKPDVFELGTGIRNEPLEKKRR